MEIRYSSNSVGRITAEIDGETKYLLGVNKKRYDKGILSLSPIGGGIEFDESSRSFLVDDLEAQLQSGNDLRFTSSKDNEETYRSWLFDRTGRETDMYREIQEELFDEPGYLSNDDPALSGELGDLVVSQEFDSIHSYEYVTNRPGATDQTTVGFFELYDIEMTDDARDYLVNMSKDSDSRIRFVSEEEILTGETDDGWSIAPNARIFVTDEFRMRNSNRVNYLPQNSWSESVRKSNETMGHNSWFEEDLSRTSELDTLDEIVKKSILEDGKTYGGNPCPNWSNVCVNFYEKTDLELGKTSLRMANKRYNLNQIVDEEE
jgi:hypothetical protein